jgi:hypothetical protein
MAIMSYKEKQTREVFKVFKKLKVLTIIKLTAIMMCCERTIQRRLKSWGAYYTSYNKNCRYYTLADIPRFNQYGIWKYKGIFFSKFGNLKNTVIAVVKQSESGLSAHELSEIIALPSYTFLSHFKNDPNIQREKHKGVYVYFSKDLDEFDKQKRKRKGIIQSKALLDLPTDAEAIIVLVELIKHPADKIDQLSSRIHRKGVPISTHKINNLLTYHGILKKNPGICPHQKPEISY